jgi:hypothetical protein
VLRILLTARRGRQGKKLAACWSNVSEESEFIRLLPDTPGWRF